MTFCKSNHLRKLYFAQLIIFFTVIICENDILREDKAEVCFEDVWEKTQHSSRLLPTKRQKKALDK